MQRTGPHQCFCCKKFWGTGCVRGPQCDCNRLAFCYRETCGKCAEHCKCKEGVMNRAERIALIRAARLENDWIENLTPEMKAALEETLINHKEIYEALKDR